MLYVEVGVANYVITRLTSALDTKTILARIFQPSGMLLLLLLLMMMIIIIFNPWKMSKV